MFKRKLYRYSYRDIRILVYTGMCKHVDMHFLHVKNNKMFRLIF